VHATQTGGRVDPHSAPSSAPSAPPSRHARALARAQPTMPRPKCPCPRGVQPCRLACVSSSRRRAWVRWARPVQRSEAGRPVLRPRATPGPHNPLLRLRDRPTGCSMAAGTLHTSHCSAGGPSRCHGARGGSSGHARPRASAGVVPAFTAARFMAGCDQAGVQGCAQGLRAGEQENLTPRSGAAPFGAECIGSCADPHTGRMTAGAGGRAGPAGARRRKGEGINPICAAAGAAGARSPPLPPPAPAPGPGCPANPCPWESRGSAEPPPLTSACLPPLHSALCAHAPRARRPRRDIPRLCCAPTQEQQRSGAAQQARVPRSSSLGTK
jgi:hypothetical protein